MEQISQFSSTDKHDITCLEKIGLFYGVLISLRG